MQNFGEIIFKKSKKELKKKFLADIPGQPKVTEMSADPKCP